MITIKNDEEIKLMKEAGLLVSKTRQYLEPFIKPGITTKELNRLAEEYITKNNGVCSCKGYNGFPAALCISVNDTVVHGIPSEEKLSEGDIVSIDIVIGLNGYQGDSAWTFPVGKINDDKKYLLEHTEKSLYEGIKQALPGNRIGDISNAIEEYALQHNLGVIKELCGHGIGKNMHEDPDVPNFGKKGTGVELKPGMVICIEPMHTFGKEDIFLEDDEWSIKTIDNSDAAHFEFTVLITENGNEILTPKL